MLGYRGGSRILGKGGSNKYIHNWGRVREGEVPPPVTAKGSGGALIAPPAAPAAFLLLRFFSMKLTVISIHIHVHHAISGLLQPAWIATRKLFILHNTI